jgi:hypothetical protein
MSSHNILAFPYLSMTQFPIWFLWISVDCQSPTHISLLARCVRVNTWIGW